MYCIGWKAVDEHTPTKQNKKTKQKTLMGGEGKR
jgi:hypothetical protein